MVEVDKEIKEITIPFEEYKELLIIKGKYEELKEKFKSVTVPYQLVNYRSTNGKRRMDK